MQKLLAIDDFVQAAHGRCLLQKHRLYTMGETKARHLWADGLFWWVAVQYLQQAASVLKASFLKDFLAAVRSLPLG